MGPNPPSWRRFLIPGAFVLLLFVVLYGRVPEDVQRVSEPAAREIHSAAFGTTLSIKVWGRPEVADDVIAEAIAEVITSVNDSMSTYNPRSELSRFNAAPVGVTATISAGFAAVMVEAEKIFEETGGAFDPTVGPIVDAWGFGPEERVEPPKPEEIAVARTKVGMPKLRFEGVTLEKSVEGLHLDLSAIAKGWAVDEAARALDGLGFENHLVEIGGEVRATGSSPKGRPWKVGIERPEAGIGSRVAAAIPLDGASLATSGGYRNFVTIDGARVTHIIDPRTGEPVGHGLGSVSVLAASCVRADALATALFVMGAEEGLAWAESQGVAALFLTLADEKVERASTGTFDRITRASSSFGGAPVAGDESAPEEKSP